MQIFLKLRNKGAIEQDQQLLKFIFESRQSYTINEALLETRLLFDSLIRNRKQMINTVTDLEACYNRQFPNIGRIIEESIGIDRKGIKLIIKVLPITLFFIDFCLT